jgi:hypothetical protein
MDNVADAAEFDDKDVHFVNITGFVADSSIGDRLFGATRPARLKKLWNFYVG